METEITEKPMTLGQAKTLTQVYNEAVCEFNKLKPHLSDDYHANWPDRLEYALKAVAQAAITASRTDVAALSTPQQVVNKPIMPSSF